MTQEEMFANSPGEIHQALRELFIELGGNVSCVQVWTEAVRRGLVPPEYIATMAIRGGTAEVKRALKEKTDTDMPFAGPLSDKPAAEWKQIALFDYEDMCGRLIRKHGSAENDIRAIVRERDYCRDRYGNSPDSELPLLAALEEISTIV